jgi:hypothetical protein
MVGMEPLRSALVHWGPVFWQNVTDVTTTPSVLGLHVVDLTSETFDAGRWIVFSILEQETGALERRGSTVRDSTT